MAYTVTNFKTKKALKEAVIAYEASNKDRYAPAHEIERNKVRCYNPGLGPDLSNYTGKVCLEGPHYPSAHTWYRNRRIN